MKKTDRHVKVIRSVIKKFKWFVSRRSINYGAWVISAYFYLSCIIKHFMTVLTGNNKHLMTGLKGISEFCFPRTLNVSWGEADERTIWQFVIIVMDTLTMLWRTSWSKTDRYMKNWRQVSECLLLSYVSFAHVLASSRQRQLCVSL